MSFPNPPSIESSKANPRPSTPPSLTNYAFHGTTNSLCPDCLEVVPAKIIVRGKRVYFRKRCPTHGTREDFICSDVEWFDRYDFATPAKRPKQVFTKSAQGCPRDCGICDEHEQHTCIGVLELTDNCNLSCPMCYAASSPHQKHRSFEEIVRAIDALVQAEGTPDVLQLSGGEPTTHPEFDRILDYALSQPITYVMINTNGILLASNDSLVAKLAENRDRIEIYFQLDGLSDSIHRPLRGANLQEIKMKALERIGAAGLHATLVCTLQPDLNLNQLGPIIDFASTRPWISGLSLQPATYSGRHVLPESLEKRITFPDVIQALCEQKPELFTPSDFFPLPCAHPNCHILALAYRFNNTFVPLTRFIDAQANLDLLANGLSFTRQEGARLVQQYLSRQSCCGPEGCAPTNDLVSLDTSLIKPNSSNDPKQPASSQEAANHFFAAALAEQIGAQELFRITITSFLDAYNFDLRRLMKCCTHHLLPSGHIIPFCAYNVLYRNGHIPLPPLQPSQP